MVQGSRARRRRLSAKVSSGLSLTVVPAQATRRGNSVMGQNRHDPASGLRRFSKAEVGFIALHPVKDDAEFASERNLGPLGAPRFATFIARILSFDQVAIRSFR